MGISAVGRLYQPECGAPVADGLASCHAMAKQHLATSAQTSICATCPLLPRPMRSRAHGARSGATRRSARPYFSSLVSRALMDRNIDQALSILEDLAVEHGMFQTVIDFSSSRATAWFMDNPFRYRLLDHEALADPDICLTYPRQAYPMDALIPPGKASAPSSLPCANCALKTRPSICDPPPSMSSTAWSASPSRATALTSWATRNSSTAQVRSGSASEEHLKDVRSKQEMTRPAQPQRDQNGIHQRHQHRYHP